MNEPSCQLRIYSRRPRPAVVLYHDQQSGQSRSRRLGYVSARYVRAILRLPLYGARIVVRSIAGPRAWHRNWLLPVLIGTGPTYISRGPERVKAIVSDFHRLTPDQQAKVAKNLAQLWDNFLEVFGGLSGFWASPLDEQKACMDKLEAAVQRLESNKRSETGFQYVTVELMRLYLAFLFVGRTDKLAVALGTLVVPLINRGRQMAASSQEPAHGPMEPPTLTSVRS
jgi:hypothetical protein